MSIVAIINPISGAGADPAAGARRIALVRSEVERRGRRAEIHVTERTGHAHDLAAASAAAGAELVIVWGGDGTMNEAGAACSTPTPRSHSCVPDRATVSRARSVCRARHAPPWPSLSTAVRERSTPA